MLLKNSSSIVMKDRNEIVYIFTTTGTRRAEWAWWMVTRSYVVFPVDKSCFWQQVLIYFGPWEKGIFFLVKTLPLLRINNMIFKKLVAFMFKTYFTFSLISTVSPWLTKISLLKKLYIKFSDRVKLGSMRWFRPGGRFKQ